MAYLHIKERYTPFIPIHLATDPSWLICGLCPVSWLPVRTPHPTIFLSFPRVSAAAEFFTKKIQISKFLVPPFLLPSLHLWGSLTGLSLYFLMKSVRRIECQEALRPPVPFSFSPISGLVHPSPELRLMPGHSRVKSFLSNKHPYIETPGCFHPDIVKVTSTRDTQKHTH